MEELVTKDSTQSSACWQAVEEMARRHIEQWLQGLLEDEVTQFLGRARYRRREVGERGYRNGYGKPRQLTTRAGTVTVRRPRVRALEERFESALLPLFARRTPEVNDVLPELYLHGLALGDFELALRGLFGEEAPLSASTVARVKDRWHQEAAAWHGRSLAELDLVYLWVDGVYVKAGLEKDKAALLVAIGGLGDGRKVLIALRSAYRESTESWKGLMRDVGQRGFAVRGWSSATGTWGSGRRCRRRIRTRMSNGAGTSTCWTKC
jgi:putative transposase